MRLPVRSLVLAVDGGSQSTKVSVVGADGTVHAEGRAPLRPYALGPGGRAVHPDDDLWTSLGDAARQALAGVDPREVVAVGLCGIRFCRRCSTRTTGWSSRCGAGWTSGSSARTSSRPGRRG